jgi:hypothetical protein
MHYTVTINVGTGNNVTAASAPQIPSGGLQEGDTVTFKSRNPRLHINYNTVDVPVFAEIPPKTPFLIGLSKGPFTVTKTQPAKNPFQCGLMVSGEFSPWTGGGHTGTGGGNG